MTSDLEGDRQAHLAVVAKSLGVPLSQIQDDDTQAKIVTQDAVDLLRAFFRIADAEARQRCVDYVKGELTGGRK